VFGAAVQIQASRAAGSSLFKFTLALDDFDITLLPADAQQRGTPPFRDAVKKYFNDEFSRIGGWSSVEVDNHAIEVNWTPERQAADPLAQVVEKLIEPNILARSCFYGSS
jgi:hypothetical protein